MAKKYILKESSIDIFIGSSLDLGTATWTEIPEVFNMERGSIEAELVDVTSFSSEGDFREELTGFKSFSDGTIEFYELIGDTVQQQIIDALGGDPISLRVTKTDGIKTKSIKFLVNVTGEAEPLAPGEAASLAYTIKRTGAPVVEVTTNA
ncbi:MAG: hypothetical protein IPK75_12795 [Acidobacteria bacterium]|nr:hypothetical protein [Acidobacteriota bacterium]